MEYAKALIDKAGEMCGSFYKLSKLTQHSQATISEIRSGKRQLPLEWVPELAELAGVDPREALARCMAERLPEGSRARAILGGVTATGAAVMLLFFVVLGLMQPSPTYAAEMPKRSNALTVCTSWNIWRSVRFLLIRARGAGLAL